ncbi:hypothetical protein GOODEAATRI_015157 [Goodea atripinnis]|uniref:tetrahydrofolate synthase n=1 Tax=Goodea atripinnis TaxID=208336 RepID=A0ABV0P5H3_9TELE
MMRIKASLFCERPSNHLSFVSQDAVCTLNTLQTNASALEQVRRGRSHPQLQLQAMRGFLERAGLTVRERIRINGQPISKDLFTKYFCQVYGRLDETKEAHGGTMPAYFRFLTILAFHVFLQEKMVSLISCLTCLSSPTVSHLILAAGRSCVYGPAAGGRHGRAEGPGQRDKGVSVFGGMVPPAAPQLYVILSLFQCPLWVCPDLDKYPTDSGPLRLGLAGQHQHSNASLALQLSHTWLQRRCGPGVTGTLKTHKRSSLPDPENNCVSQAASFKPSSVMVKGESRKRSVRPGEPAAGSRSLCLVSGLADAEWAGRTQTLRHGALTYFLDGAHTRRSMQACIQWFRETATQHERNAR